MDRTCEQCGKTFKAKRSDARLCGPACRQAASRAARRIKLRRNRVAVAMNPAVVAPVAPLPPRETPGLGPLLATIEARLATIEGRLVVMGRVQAGMNQTVAGMERQLGALETTAARIPGIETSLSSLAAKVREVKVGLKGVKADLVTEVNARQELGTDLVAVSQQMAAFAEAVTPGRRR